MVADHVLKRLRRLRELLGPLAAGQLSRVSGALPALTHLVESFVRRTRAERANGAAESAELFARQFVEPGVGGPHARRVGGALEVEQRTSRAERRASTPGRHPDLMNSFGIIVETRDRIVPGELVDLLA